KSPNDSRLYRLIHLENGLQALLVHDPEIYPEGPPKTETIDEDEEEEEEEDDEEDEEDGMDDDDDEEEDEDEEEEGSEVELDVDGREGGKAAANQSKKSPLSVRLRDGLNMSRGNLDLTRRFSKIELGPTPNYKVVSQSSLRFVGPLAIRFRLSGHPPFISMHQIFPIA
ncbi:nardilysin-like, partial [Trifolium medium]|nr:nardilysin-like [Trifolium medium]